MTVTSEEEDMAMKPIPDGFVLLSTYDERVGDEHKSGPRGDYQRLLREVNSRSSSISAYKDGKQWVARKVDIDQFLARLTADKDRIVGVPKPVLVSPQPTRPILFDMSASRAAAALERIADALESLATQPEATRQTPFGNLIN
jgi:hypothetical protein